MKKILLPILLCGGLSVVAQTPFTITYSNFPVYVTFNQRDAQVSTNPITTVTPGNLWNISNLSGPVGQLVYYPETDPVLTSQGIDVYYRSFKNLNVNSGYDLDYCIDFNNNGVDESAAYVYAQGYDLQPITGNINDSIIFEQQYVFFTGRRLMKFPATYQTSWSSTSRRVVDFILNVPLFGLNYQPCKHIFTVVKNDEIISYGKMRVFTPNGPSIDYDVLLQKTNQITVDSFYIGNDPAPQQLLDAFGVTQGQVSSERNAYFFFRQGISTPLLVVNYTNNTFTVPFSPVFVDSENLQTASSSLNDPNTSSDFSFVFPNPVVNGEVNVMTSFFNENINKSYRLMDMSGKVLSSGNINQNSEIINIKLPSSIPSGNYILQVNDATGKLKVSEKIVVQN